MKNISNLPASILSKLLQYSRDHAEDYNHLLIRYISERFLFRLGESQYKDLFLLKGAYLLTYTLEKMDYRTTKDIDFLKNGPVERESLRSIFTQICSRSSVDDGILFDTDQMLFQDIKEQDAYQGLRVKIPAFIGKARVVLQIDIGTGDSVYPGEISIHIPSILEQGDPDIRAYPIETVIAEKLEAIVSMGMMTSRMKDFFDLYFILSHMEIEYAVVSVAVKRTFERRRTSIPESMPSVFSEEILGDKNKQKQWTAFLRKINRKDSDISLDQVVSVIRVFIEALWFQDSP